MDTLRGSLDTFALPDIVRLIASSDKTGRLTADSFRIKGRIFLTKGTVSYATTRGEDGDIEELKRMTTSRALRRERRGRKETSPGQTLEDLIEQQVVEVFVRLMRMQGGKFVFDEGTETRAYGSGSPLALDVDKLVSQAVERIAEWEDIESVVPTSTTRFSLNQDLADDEFEVTLDGRSWTFLAAVGESASVQDLAERLRIFEFPAAKKVAEFVRRGLLAPTETPADHAAVNVTVAASDTKPGGSPPLGDAVDHAVPAAKDRPTPPGDGAEDGHGAPDRVDVVDDAGTDRGGSAEEGLVPGPLDAADPDSAEWRPAPDTPPPPP